MVILLAIIQLILTNIDTMATFEIPIHETSKIPFLQDLFDNCY